jgi:hypothetical protein
MAIAATLKYSLFLHLIRALLVLLIGGIMRGRFARGPRLRLGRDCAWVDAAPQQCLRLKWRRPAGTPCAGIGRAVVFLRVGVNRGASYMSLRSSLEVQLSQPVIVSIPHHLGREEAVRRIKSGLAAARSNYSALLNIREETWDGDSLVFNMSTLGQSAAGRIDIAEDHVRLEVTLPWLLAKFAEKLTPAIRKEATLMLEKK